MASPQFIQSSHSMYRGLSYSSHSGQLECLLGTTSKWCCFAFVHMILAFSHQISAAHRGYTQAVVTCPQAVRAPCPTFSTTPHTWPMFTHKLATWLQTQGTQ